MLSRMLRQAVLLTKRGGATGPPVATTAPTFHGATPIPGYWVGDGTSRSIPNPVGTVAGDLLIMVMAVDVGGANLPAPGFTQIASAASIGTNFQYRILTRTATNDSGDTQAISPSAGAYGGAVKVTIKNCSGVGSIATPVNVAAATGATAGPALVTTTAKQLGLSIGCRYATAWAAQTGGTLAAGDAANYLAWQFVTVASTTPSGENLGGIGFNFASSQPRTVFGLLLNGV